MLDKDRQTRSYRLYQLRVRSDFELAAAPIDDPHCDVEFVRAEPDESQPFELTDSTLRYDNPAAGLELHIRESLYCLRYHEVGDFFLSDASRVSFYAASDVDQDLVTALLQGPIFAMLLELRGIACLHASAVQIESHVVALVGDTGSGKSSVAAHLVARGYPLVTDDVLPVTIEGERCLASPGYPQLKLCPDMVDRLAVSAEFKPCLQKHLQQVGHGWGSFASQALPLRAVYLLQREHEHDLDPPVAIGEFGPRDSFVELMRFRFCARAIGPLGLEAAGFQTVGGIAERVAVRRLCYPDGIEQLPLVCDAIVKA